MRKTNWLIKILIGMTSIFMALGFAACSSGEGGGGGSSSSTPTPGNNTFQLNYAEYSLTLNETFTLTAFNAKEGTTLEFSSDNEDVATVSEDGVVTGCSVGQALITCEAGEDKADCLVSVVTEANQNKLSLFVSSFTMRADGDDFEIIVLYNDEPITEGITYESSDTSIVTVSDAGVVHAVGKGQTTVKVSYDGLTTYGNVTVKTINSVQFQQNAIYLKPNAQQEIAVKAYEGTALQEVENPNFTWEVVDPDVAEVVEQSGKYYLKAKASGSTTLKVSFEEATHTCLVGVATMVSTADEFEEQANLTGAYMVLANDIDLSSLKWKGTSGASSDYVVAKFSGYLDGDGHKLTIKKYVATASGLSDGNSKDAHNAGFFREITSTAVIENLIVEASMGYNLDGTEKKVIYHKSGLLAWQNSGVIQNCYFQANIRMNKSGNAATSFGLVYRNNATGVIRNVITDFAVKSDTNTNPETNPYAYGFAVTNQGGVIENCVTVSAAVSGSVYRWMSSNMGTTDTSVDLGEDFSKSEGKYPANYKATVNQYDAYRNNCAVFLTYADLLNGEGKGDKYDGATFDSMAHSVVASTTAQSWLQTQSTAWSFTGTQIKLFNYVIYDAEA